jgi:hypothetical protein
METMDADKLEVYSMFLLPVERAREIRGKLSVGKAVQGRRLEPPC